MRPSNPSPLPCRQIFAMTGATAVCLVCYIIPVSLHLKLRQKHAGDVLGSADRRTDPILSWGHEAAGQAGSGLEEALLGCGDGGAGPTTAPAGGRRVGVSWPQCREVVREVAVPLVVAALGVAFSCAALLPLLKGFLRG
jgi:hypothetical protein